MSHQVERIQLVRGVVAVDAVFLVVIGGLFSIPAKVGNDPHWWVPAAVGLGAAAIRLLIEGLTGRAARRDASAVERRTQPA
jgi:hypothetical protein